MVYAHQILRQKGREPALLRKHSSEDNFGVQIAASKSKLAADAARMAQDVGAKYVDLNCGCPIHDTVNKGMGARLLQKVSKLGTILGCMVEAVDIPITVKLRIGFSEKKINIYDTVKAAVDAGVSAVIVHGRTREQRYSRAADWPLLAEISAKSEVPIYGNGDILTPMEARQRLDNTQLAGAMIARGALIKPWIFKELTEQKEWLPTAEEQWGVICTFTQYLKDHFGDDDLGRRRGLDFLAWHIDWFSRYRPLPESQWATAAAEHPLIQTRSVGEPELKLPGKPDESERRNVAAQLWDSENPDELWKEFL